jgi:hypothetical protein
MLFRIDAELTCEHIREEPLVPGLGNRIEGCTANEATGRVDRTVPVKQAPGLAFRQTLHEVPHILRLFRRRNLIQALNRERRIQTRGDGSEKREVAELNKDSFSVLSEH